ncbi:hypothetical protein LT337_32200 (plasmid) [Mycolicibacterium fortuitum]|nr:hypothetical protein LT337_32200 [Mycolicibacterium fortuitum]
MDVTTVTSPDALEMLTDDKESRHADLTLIGGPARVGKTTLARRWTATRPAELVHLDHLLHAVAAVATGDELSALRQAPSITTHSPEQWLAGLRERDEVLWKAAGAYSTAAKSGLVLEGGLWPDWVANISRPHAAIFIVDTGDSADRLVDITRADPHSWMAQRRWPEEKIRKWACYNMFRSTVIAELADRHGYPVFDIADGIAAAQDKALAYLATITSAGMTVHEH